MRPKLTVMFLIGAVVCGAAVYVDRVFATPASGFVGTTIAKGRFGPIDTFVWQAVPGSSRAWVSAQSTNGSSDVYVQNNTWTPGGTTGWHTHPGHSLIIVTAGAVTAYEGNDPSCTPHVYTVGMGFVDPGGDHVHVLRNEGAVDAQTIAVQVIPPDAGRRIDAAGNPACGF